MLDLNEFAKMVHENSKAHGWWEQERPMGEVIALIHSELSEALEEFRAGRPMVWHDDNGKPEGITVELADAFIRIFDFLGHNECNVSVATIPELIGAMTDEQKTVCEGLSFPEYICVLHYFTSRAFVEGDKLETIAKALLRVATLIVYWINAQGLDAEEIILEKHEYNKSRPYRHGGKKC